MNSKRKRKPKKRNKKLKINEKENINSYDIESSSFLNIKKKNKNTIFEIKSYKKLYRIIFYLILLFIMLFFFKSSKKQNKIKFNSVFLFNENLNNQSIINLYKNKQKSKLKNYDGEKKAISFHDIIINPQNLDLINNPEYKPDFITKGKIFWNNNKNDALNLTLRNEEISSYENITPQFKNKEELYQREIPKVSLIIPVYKQERFIKKIYAIIEQQSLKDIEMVFIDDCSPDNSSKIIKELMEIDKRIIYIRNEKNRGGFYTRNIGVLKSRGEYIFCLDIDDYLLNDILKKSLYYCKNI